MRTLHDKIKFSKSGKKITLFEVFVTALLGFIILAILGFVLAVGKSSGGYIVYEGQEMPVGDAEEYIEDLLEIENPRLDLEVDIYEEIDN